jgi:hypothetical protein
MNSLTWSAMFLAATLGTVVFAGPAEITRIEPVGGVMYLPKTDNGRGNMVEVSAKQLQVVGESLAVLMNDGRIILMHPGAQFQPTSVGSDGARIDAFAVSQDGVIFTEEILANRRTLRSAPFRDPFVTAPSRVVESPSANRPLGVKGICVVGSAVWELATDNVLRAVNTSAAEKPPIAMPFLGPLVKLAALGDTSIVVLDEVSARLYVVGTDSRAIRELPLISPEVASAKKTAAEEAPAGGPTPVLITELAVSGDQRIYVNLSFMATAEGGVVLELLADGTLARRLRLRLPDSGASVKLLGAAANVLYAVTDDGAVSAFSR